jgi:hypothetical protein
MGILDLQKSDIFCMLVVLGLDNKTTPAAPKNRSLRIRFGWGQYTPNLSKSTLSNHLLTNGRIGRFLEEMEVTKPSGLNVTIPFVWLLYRSGVIE